MILHYEDMSYQSKVILQWHGFNAEGVGLLYALNACEEVTPANVEDGVETMLVKALKETYVTVVGHKSL